MALSAALTRAGHPPKTLDTNAFVHLPRSDSGYEIPLIELVVVARVDGLVDSEFQQIANVAKETCPLSRALRATTTTLRATLAASV